MKVRDFRDSQRERQKLNWKPRQKGPENWPADSKMKRSVPSARTHASANCHGQKAWSGLKYVLNKLSKGWREHWSHSEKQGEDVDKYNDEKLVQDTEREENRGHEYQFNHNAVNTILKQII